MAEAQPASQPSSQAVSIGQQLLDQPLPSISRTGVQLSKLMTQGTLTYQAMSEHIRQDPVLALKLLRSANEAIRSDESLVKTLTQAISLLGEDFLLKLLQETPLPEKADRPESQLFLKAMTNSLFAAHLAERLAVAHFHGREDECYWAALFWGAPLWYLARFHTKGWQQLLNANLPTRAGNNRLLNESLGCGLDDYWQAAQDILKLPDLVHFAMLEDTWQNRRLCAKARSLCRGPAAKDLGTIQTGEIRQFLVRPQQLLMLCNQAAFHASQDWQSRGFQNASRLLAVLTGWPLQRVVHEAHQAAVDSVRKHPLPGSISLLAGLFIDPVHEQPAPEARQAPRKAETPTTEPVMAPAQKDPAPQPQPATKPEEEPANSSAEPAQPAEEDNRILVRKPRMPAPENGAANGETITRKPRAIQAPKSRKGNRDLYQRLCETMMKDPASFRDMAHLMETLNRCLISGAGLETALVLLANRQADQFRTYFSQGTQGREALGQLSLPSQQGILSRLMSKQASLWVSPEKMPRLAPQLPAPLLEASATDDFFLYSLHVGKRPIALVYADGGPGKNHLTDFDNENFKHACTGASNVLYYMARKKATNHGK